MVVLYNQSPYSPVYTVSGIFGSTYRMLSNIRVAFCYMDKDMMRKILTTMVCPRLEYAAVVWFPHMKKLKTETRAQQKSGAQELSNGTLGLSNQPSGLQLLNNNGNVERSDCMRKKRVRDVNVVEYLKVVFGNRPKKTRNKVIEKDLRDVGLCREADRDCAA